jgi:hypothetical protein
MFSSRGTVRYEERGQGYRDIKKVGKHCSIRPALHSAWSPLRSMTIIRPHVSIFALIGLNRIPLERA